MSSSEPRLIVGDGPLEVRPLEVPGNPPVFAGEAAVAPPSQPPTDGSSTSAVAVVFDDSPNIQLGKDSVAAADSSARPSSGKSNDALPALVTFSDLLFEAPAWLFSAAIHMLAVIILALLFIVPERPFELILQLDDSEGFDEISGTDFDLNLDVQQELADSALDPQELVALEDPVLAEPTEIELPILQTEALQVASPIQQALTGRSQGLQQKLVEAYGGNASTQRAVAMALRWLQRNQTSQGMWSLKGPYSDGSRIENREAATGLALLAFQGAGYTPHGDPQHDFTKVTARAWKSLLRSQDKDGIFFQNAGRHNGQLYTQAICTIAICELYGMTRDSRYRDPAQRAIDYAVEIQASEGGWRYTPGSDSDLSVTGWFVMALQSARMAGLNVPTPALQRVSEFLDSVSYSGGASYGYHQSHRGATASMTAEGLLCRQYLGWKQDDTRLVRGATFLNSNLPSWQQRERDVYYWYYATQVCHHMEGRYWRIWNDRMKSLLPKHQEQEGKERGSWDPEGDEWGDQAGRLFTTCLSTFMLEVYYRHLPIYNTEILGIGL